MSQSNTEAMGDSAAIDAARVRHPSSYADRVGCDQCVADGHGRVALCAVHLPVAQHRIYAGEPTFGPCDVTVTQSGLTTGEVIATWPLRCLSDAGGYSWGFSGRGPSLLADAILRDALGVLAEPVEMISFRDDIIAKLTMGEAFELSQADVLAWHYDYAGHKGGSALAGPRRGIDVEIATAVAPMLRRAGES